MGAIRMGKVGRWEKGVMSLAPNFATQSAHPPIYLLAHKLHYNLAFDEPYCPNVPYMMNYSIPHDLCKRILDGIKLLSPG